MALPQFSGPCMPTLLNFIFGFASSMSWEVGWDAGTGLRCCGLLVHSWGVVGSWDTAQTCCYFELPTVSQGILPQHCSPLLLGGTKRLLGSTGSMCVSLMNVLVSSQSQWVAGDCRSYKSVAQKPTKSHQNIAKDFVQHPKISFPSESLVSLALYRKSSISYSLFDDFHFGEKEKYKYFSGCKCSFSVNATPTVLHFQRDFCLKKILQGN